MNQERPLVLGVAPTRRQMFKSDFALANKVAILQKTASLVAGLPVRIVDIDWLNEEGILSNLRDVSKVADYFRQARVDAVFMPHCNFGSEEVVAKLGKEMGKPFLLWGARDPAPPPGRAARQTDTQCGLFASSKALQRYGVPFTYVENCWLDDPVFERGLTAFLRTAAAVRAFRTARIGQISLRPKPFLSVMYNESELLERFGIEVVPVTALEIVGRITDILQTRPDEVHDRVIDIQSKMDCSTMPAEGMSKIAATELAIAAVAEEMDCDLMASECWSTYGKSFGIRPCFLFGDMIDRGLIVACETDICGAVTMNLLRAATLGQGMPFLADLTVRHPTNANAELLWHCGPFPQTLAREPAKRELVRYTGFWELKHGTVTVARFDGIGGDYKLFAGEGHAVEGPPTNGNYLWVEVDDWAKWEKKLIYGPYIHHVACIHGNWADVLEETSKYLSGVAIDRP
jgi:L-fucose isomerase-like protein